VTEEERRAARQPRSARRAREPFVAAIGDGVNSGYDALEYVYEGLRESLRLRTGAERSGQAVRRQRGRARDRDAGDTGALDDLAGLVSNLLGTASDIVQEFAQFVGERSSTTQTDVLVMETAPNESVTVIFEVHNTGTTRLRNVALLATDLIGDGPRIPAEAVSFEPPSIPNIARSASITTKVTVAVPSGTTPDTYRGVVQAEPGSAWAVLELRVVPGEHEAAEQRDGEETTGKETTGKGREQATRESARDVRRNAPRRR
jgi:hypothetical protein